MANYKKQKISIGTYKYVPEEPVNADEKTYKFFITGGTPPAVIFELGRETYSTDPNVMAFYNDLDYDLIRFSKMMELLKAN